MRSNGIFGKLAVVAAIAAALGGGYTLGTHTHKEAEAQAGATGTAEQKTKYTCGMHPFIIQDEPGLCPICGMKLTPMKDGAGAGQAAAERKVKHWISPMDPTYVRNEPGKDHMGHDLVPVYEDAGGGAGISVDPVTAQNMGVRTEMVARRDLSRTVRTLGLVTYDEPRRFTVNTKIEGWVEKLFVNQEGQAVKKGQALMEIYSPELVAAQQEYLLSVRNAEKLGASPFGEIAESSRRLVEASRNRLKYWDISDKQIAALEQSGQVRKTLTLHSPYGGVVTMKKVFEGMRVMPGEELLQVSDISRVWVNADIYEYELPWVKVGQSAEVELPFGPGKVISGKVSFIEPYLQGETRTVRARIELPNPGLELKPDMYANVRIRTSAVAGALSVSEHAVLQSGKGKTVFVALGGGKFEPRVVQTGVSDEQGHVQILSGLSEGEGVVTSAQFMLDSESKLREALQKMTTPAGAHQGHESGEGGKGSGGASGQKPKKDIEDLFK